MRNLRHKGVIGSRSHTKWQSWYPQRHVLVPTFFSIGLIIMKIAAVGGGDIWGYKLFTSDSDQPITLAIVVFPESKYLLIQVEKAGLVWVSSS